MGDEHLISSTTGTWWSDIQEALFAPFAVSGANSKRFSVYRVLLLSNAHDKNVCTPRCRAVSVEGVSIQLPNKWNDDKNALYIPKNSNSIVPFNPLPIVVARLDIEELNVFCASSKSFFVLEVKKPRREEGFRRGTKYIQLFYIQTGDNDRQWVKRNDLTLFGLARPPGKLPRHVVKTCEKSCCLRR